MKRKTITKKMLSMMLASSMVVGSASALTACGSKDDVITLDVYSQVANYQGLQTGWGADVLMDKFNVKFNIINNQSGVYETRAESGDLGDIVIFGNDSTDYVDAVENNLLYDWNEDDLLTEYGADIKEKMPDAIKKNQNLTSEITGGERDTLYGISNSIATSSEDHDAFFYTWDIRWDLYKELGYPEVKDLDDFEQLLKDMHKICPSDDAGNPTYAVSLWPDWDDAMVMYVKATGTAYYGYDELGIGLYDTQTGTYHDALEEDGPYLQMLKFYNNLFQDGLVDPDSMTQTYDQMSQKVQNGGVLFSIFNYSGQLAYNTDEHTEAGKLMYCMKPEEATPIVYGMNTSGGSYVMAMGAETEYPELCMEIMNYFATPEGRMVYGYGPKGETWDYDEEGNTYFTDLGKKCNADTNTKMENHEGTYGEGQIQCAFSTWANDAENPDSNGETYNSDNWKSNISEAETEIEQDWRDKTGCIGLNDYMESSGKYVVAPGTSYSQSKKDAELDTTWAQVTNCIIQNSWNAIYAKSDAEYDKIVAQMKKDAKSYGYDECIQWCLDEAAKRRALEEEVSQ